MSLSYFGIGASLQPDDDYVKVVNIIPGGPADIDGALQPEDRITAVAQGEDGELVDVGGNRGGGHGETLYAWAENGSDQSPKTKVQGRGKNIPN